MYGPRGWEEAGWWQVAPLPCWGRSGWATCPAAPPGVWVGPGRRGPHDSPAVPCQWEGLEVPTLESPRHHVSCPLFLCLPSTTSQTARVPKCASPLSRRTLFRRSLPDTWSPPLLLSSSLVPPPLFQKGPATGCGQVVCPTGRWLCSRQGVVPAPREGWHEGLPPRPSLSAAAQTCNCKACGCCSFGCDLVG